MRPLTTYTPFRNLNVGDFVLERLHNPNLDLLRMGRIEGDVVKDEESEYFKMVKVQWWVPMKKDQSWMNDICIRIAGMANGNVI
jgi:hypothetical protein